MTIQVSNAPVIRNPLPANATTRSSLLSHISDISEWGKRFRYRRELARLIDTGPHLIRDMGLGIDEALHEISKPFYIK